MAFKVTFLLAVAFLSGNALPNAHRRPRLDSRIIGGDLTTIEENPWQVSLKLLGLHSCGGSIINENTVVTAAHCIDILSPLLMTVHAGTADISTGGVIVGIQSTKVHENYDYLDFDIALITLAENLTFSDQIQPVTLPDSEELAAGTEVNVTGWGVTSEGGIFTPNDLYSVTVEIIDRETCNEAYAQYDTVTENMICAGVSGGGKDACQGDSGGPLTKDGVLYGLVSWGVGCAEPDYPGVYTNVVPFTSWIADNL